MQRILSLAASFPGITTVLLALGFWAMVPEKAWSAAKPEPAKPAQPVQPKASTPVGKSTQPPKPAKAAKAKKAPSGNLDKGTVKELYLAGDFDKLVALLENMRRERRMRDREDSVFIYKYLGVVYGADTATRRKAESFLYQMLRLDPQQNLVELEVGDNIQAMFREVRKRYERTSGDTLSASERETAKQNLKALGFSDSLRKDSDPGRTSPMAASSSPSAPTGSAGTASGGKEDRRWMWVAGGAAAVTLVGIGAILLLGDPETQTTTVITEVK